MAGVERVEVAEVKQVFVVEESALPHYFLVVGVYFGHDHIHEHATRAKRARQKWAKESDEEKMTLPTEASIRVLRQE